MAHPLPAQRSSKLARNHVASWALVNRIGAGLTYSPTPGNFFSGSLDETAVDWKALTPEQVRAHYLAGLGIVPVPLAIRARDGRLILNWPGNWVLQSKPALDDDPDTWQDVNEATSPYTVPEPLDALAEVEVLVANAPAAPTVTLSPGTGAPPSAAALLMRVPKAGEHAGAPTDLRFMGARREAGFKERSPGSGFSRVPRNVTLTADAPGATIRYTLDGRDPDTHSPAYMPPLVISASDEVRARAWLDGVAGPVANASYAIATNAPSVVLFVAEGAGAGDLHYSGNPVHATPHLDQLCREGLRFTQSYAAGTSNAPNQCAALTARLLPRSGLPPFVAPGSTHGLASRVLARSRSAGPGFPGRVVVARSAAHALRPRRTAVARRPSAGRRRPRRRADGRPPPS